MDSESADTRRKVKRIGIYEPTRLRPNDWSSVEIRILDISSVGFRGQCDAILMLNSWVSLDVPGVGPMHSKVLWQRRDQFGAEFIRPIDLAQCSWTPETAEGMLARLLVQRAVAQQEGNAEHERLLRSHIAAGLPIHSKSSAD